jgi:oligoribonuclease
MNKLLWLDLETTGLSPVKDDILEVGVAVTDERFNMLASNSWIIKPLSSNWSGKMDDYVKKMHTKNGLIADVLTKGQFIKSVEQSLISFCVDNGLKEKIILCGNSIHFDRSFLKQQMFAFSKLLHYREVDVSSFKIIFDLHFGIHPAKMEPPHRSMEDTLVSIEEMKFYCNLIKPIEAHI